ncbi:MAG: hypothetical protein H6673_03710 [Anaerolineales bacterium]|nr:hypothetical protein [Anaerolineales bacterium]
MRRIVVFIMLIVVVAACGGKDDEPKAVEPTNTANLPPTLPPQQTVDPLQQRGDGLPTPTLSGITRTSVSRGPTLPPARTLDPAAATGEFALTLNPTATPRETRSTGPTLPPVATQTLLPSPTERTPTITPTRISLPTIPPVPTIPDACVTFRIDLEQTNAVPPKRGEPVSIHWFAPQGTNVTYEVQLYDYLATLIFEDTTDTPYYTFAPEVFTSGATYYWQVAALMDGESMGCVPVGNELFLN